VALAPLKHSPPHDSLLYQIQILYIKWGQCEYWVRQNDTHTHTHTQEHYSKNRRPLVLWWKPCVLRCPSQEIDDRQDLTCRWEHSWPSLLWCSSSQDHATNQVTYIYTVHYHFYVLKTSRTKSPYISKEIFAVWSNFRYSIDFQYLKSSTVHCFAGHRCD